MLVVGARTATRDDNNHILTTTAPGALSELCGVTVEEFGRIPAPGANAVLNGSVFQVEKMSAGRAAESARREYMIDLGGERVRAAYGYEVLRPQADTDVLARWSSRFLAGEAAITRRRVGAGAVLYVGTYLTHALVGQLFGPLFKELGVAPPLALPAGVEASTRSNGSRRLTFVQNTSAEPATVAGPVGPIALGGYGCTILRHDADGGEHTG
jgi:beta-galactosidase